MLPLLFIGLFYFRISIVVWHPYLNKNKFYIKRVQNCFLSYTALYLKFNTLFMTTLIISSLLSTPTLTSRRLEAGIHFISSLLNWYNWWPLYTRYPLSYSMSLSVKLETTLIYIPSHCTNYYNHARMLLILNTS